MFLWKLKPETDEDIKSAETTEGMRKRLWEMSYHDPLVRNVMQAAQYRGLSGEDTMTCLAYAALLEYERLRDMMLEDYMSQPISPMVIKKS